MTILEASDIHVAYGSVNAVRGVSLTVSAGEVLAVIGANGAGKSSLLGALMGLVPSRGRVVVAGEDLSGASVKRRVSSGLSMSPEGRGILSGLTVRENLEMGTFGARGMSRQRRGERLDLAFDLFPILRTRSSQPAQTLSGGEAAMLSVARSLMPDPKVVLLDEPTLGLAPVVSARLFEQIHLMKESGITMIIVEQRVAGLLAIADSVLQMKNGSAEPPRSPDQFGKSEIDALYFGA